MKIFFIGLATIVAAALASIFFLSPSERVSRTADANVIASGGLHWHPSLEIYVGGVKQEIPQNLGLGAVHKPMHTHDDLPIVHLEFTGVVKNEDITLGKFFDIWGKGMRSFGSNMRMTVNGVDNAEYEQYIMRDKDVIELHYD